MKSLRRLSSEIRSSPDIVVTPEYLMFDPTGLARDVVYRAAEDLEGQWSQELSRMAERLGACVLGHMFLRTSSGRVANAAVLYGKDGGIMGVYRKTHLFDAYGYKESSFTEPGDRLWRPLEACGARIGVAICYELRFPEVFRAQALNGGVDLFLVPAAWYKGPGKEEALSVLSRARAHENTSYVAVASNAGPNFVGRSMIVHPFGYTLAQAPPWEWVLEQEIDLSEVAKARNSLPVLKHVKPQLYSYLPR
ncbi:hydrolase [Aeropyrum camini SY1 = JCM 12091]|uniref:Hydrolase n=1 Tax=Aeropyrum camini SY1 = JCM 12091 TaxID=1198449 RepID=U3THR4_9CREN|nr:hydrolase [Aeropyrum camini SY1 = JCM 12091]